MGPCGFLTQIAVSREASFYPLHHNERLGSLIDMRISYLKGLESHMARLWELATHIVQNQADSFGLDSDEIRVAIRLVHGTLTHLHYLEQKGIPPGIALIGKDITHHWGNRPKARR